MADSAPFEVWSAPDAGVESVRDLVSKTVEVRDLGQNKEARDKLWAEIGNPVDVRTFRSGDHTGKAKFEHEEKPDEAVNSVIASVDKNGFAMEWHGRNWYRPFLEASVIAQRVSGLFDEETQKWYEHVKPAVDFFAEYGSGGVDLEGGRFWQFRRELYKKFVKTGQSDLVYRGTGALNFLLCLNHARSGFGGLSNCLDRNFRVSALGKPVLKLVLGSRKGWSGRAKDRFVVVGYGEKVAGAAGAGSEVRPGAGGAAEARPGVRVADVAGAAGVGSGVDTPAPRGAEVAEGAVSADPVKAIFAKYEYDEADLPTFNGLSGEIDTWRKSNSDFMFATDFWSKISDGNVDRYFSRDGKDSIKYLNMKLGEFSSAFSDFFEKDPEAAYLRSLAYVSNLRLLEFIERRGHGNAIVVGVVKSVPGVFALHENMYRFGKSVLSSVTGDTRKDVLARVVDSLDALIGANYGDLDAYKADRAIYAAELAKM